MSAALINSIRSYLASHFMFVDDEWLSGCIEYLTESSSESYSEADIKSLAKEQWLLNDLKDICPGSLPANLKEQRKTTLTGRYVVQINAVIDIGTPAYQQYMKLQKVNQDNIEATTDFNDRVPSHRMIKLLITDGVQEVSAIEYKPMRKLPCDITPGCKALLKGPIDCRRGILLLTESALELLGGEVQEIAVSNSLAGLLATKLGLPMPEETQTLNTSHRNSNIPTPHSLMPPPRDDTDISRPVAIVTSLQQSMADDDIDIDQLAALEAEIDIAKPSVSRNNDSRDRGIGVGNTVRSVECSNTDVRSTTSRTHSNISTDINERITIRDIGYSRTNEETGFTSDRNRNKRHLGDSNMNPEKKAKTNTENDYPSDEDLFFEDEDHIHEMEANFDNNIATISSDPFVYIKQINELDNSKKAGRIFKVKAQIMRLLSKLSVGKEGWSLRCTIIDGTGSIDVEFTSDVLSQLVGYTPQEMNQLKKQIATKPELKEKAVLALQKAKDSLQVLYCIIELTMSETPKITKLTPFDGSHLHSLKRRFENARL